jgi:hypothetical protein
MYIKKILVLLILFIIITLFLSGCVNVDIFINVYHDESGFIDYSIAINKEFYDNFKQDDFFQDFRNSFKEKSSTFQEFDNENEHIITFKYEFSNLDELANLSEEIKKYGFSLSVDKVDSILKRTFILNAFLDTYSIDSDLFKFKNYSSDNFSNISNFINIKLKVSLPGEFVYLNNPTQYNSDENISIWEIDFQNVSRIKAVSEEIKMNFIILASVSFLIIIIIIGVLSFYSLRSLKF